MKKVSIFLAILLFIPFVSAVPITDDLITYWNFEQDGTVTDVYAGHYNLSSVGAVGYNKEGKNLLGVNLTEVGSTGYVRSVDDSILDFGTGNFTIAVWVKLLKAPGIPLAELAKKRSGGSVGYHLQVTSGRVVRFFAEGASGGNLDGNALTLNTWELYVVAGNQTGYCSYTDGTQDACRAVMPIVDSAAAFEFGNTIGSGGDPPDAIIDEAGIWNRTLNISEIGKLYATGRGRTYPLSDSILSKPIPGGNFATDSVHFNYTAYATRPGDLLVNASIYIYHINGTLFNISSQLLNGTWNDSSFIIPGMTTDNYLWNVFRCDSVVDCEFAQSNYTVLSSVNPLYDLTPTETATQYFNITFNSTTVPSANLYWDGTKHTTIITNLATNSYFASTSFDMPLFNGTKSFFWSLNNNNGNLNTTSKTQTVSSLNFSLCGASPTGVPFINFTFKNETTLQESVTATVTDSRFEYSLGLGTINKTLQFTSGVESNNYTFCGSPAGKTFNIDYFLTYDNAESQSRTINPALTTLNNLTVEKNLFLLPTGSGIFVGFQVLDSSSSPVNGANVKITRSGYGTVTETTTGPSGTVSIFLNPNVLYTLQVIKTGYASQTLTQTFPETEYTILLGSSSTTPTITTKGINLTVSPKPGTTLQNGTSYNFNMTLGSSTLTLDQFGFNLYNGTSWLASVNATTATGGFLSQTLNTGTHDFIKFEYFWVVGGNRSDGTYSYGITSATSGSLTGFITRLKTYTGQGIFGIDNFSLVLIALFGIVLTLGIFTYNFGFGSPLSIAWLLVGLVALFDMGFGMLQTGLFPTGTATGIIIVIAILVTAREFR